MAIRETCYRSGCDERPHLAFAYCETHLLEHAEARKAGTGGSGLTKVKNHPGIYRTLRGDYKAVKRGATKTFSRLEDAERWKGDRNAGVNRALARTSLKDYAEQWMRGHANLKPKSRAQYENLLRNHIYPVLGARQLGKLDKPDVKAWIVKLREGGTGATTVGQAFAFLGTVLESAKDEGYITTNPARFSRQERERALEKPKQRKKRYLNEDEVARLAAAINPRYRALVFTLAYGGLRIGEATALEVSNLDLEPRAGAIHVEYNAPEVNGTKLTRQTPKTERSLRTVLIGPTLVAILAEHVATYCPSDDPRSLVFTNSENHPVKQSDFLRQQLRPAAKRAGIAPPLPVTHDLRHTAASLMAAAGFSLLEAGEQLGHTAAAMTAAYSHLYQSRLRERVDQYEALVLTEPQLRPLPAGRLVEQGR